MKKAVYSISTFLFILLLNFIASKFLKYPFLELSFMVGLFSSVIIYFFSSKGGITTSIVDLPIKYLLSSEDRKNNHFIQFNINIPFVVAVIYTIISAFISVYAYWDYFF